MSRPWAIRMPADRLDAVGRLRLEETILALADGDWVWLRAGRRDENLELRLRALPGAQRFDVLADGQLVPSGHQVPTARLPNGEWTLLRDWLRLELPRAEFARRPQSGVAITVVRTSEPGEPGLLLTSARAWHAYGVGAPQARLDRWTFAMSPEGRVVVRGTPLPPIPGEAFIETDGVAVAAGWRWDPPVDAQTLREALGTSPRDVALLHADGSWERIPAEHFVKATRSAIRASMPSIEGGS